jgi:Ca2+-binding EF-hand superfamily protein
VALSEQRLQEYSDVFTVFDSDKDGFITVEELMIIFASIGYNITPQEMREMIGRGAYSQYAQRGGRIDFQMFTNLMAVKMMKVDSERQFKDAFEMLDRDERGYVTCTELRKIVGYLGQHMSEEDVYTRWCSRPFPTLTVRSLTLASKKS